MARIAFYAPLKPLDHPTPSGDRRIGRLLVQALGRAGFQVQIASTLRSFDPVGDPARFEALQAQARHEAKTLVRAARELGARERPSAWFTYHVYHKAPDLIGPIVAELLGIPYVIAEASHAEKRRSGPWAQGLAAAERAIRRADRILCLNPADRPGLARLLGHERSLVDLAPFLDCVDFMRRLPDPADARAQWLSGRSTSGPVLAVVAMMRPGDKLDSYRMLARVLRRLGDRPWHLLVAGDGPARREVEALLAGLEDRVTLAGALEPTALAGLLRASDLVVWPAVGEAYGMALLEAQAAGVPVVAGGYGGVPAIVHDGVTGLVTLPGDEAAFAAALASLIDDPGRRRQLAQATRPTMLDRHDIDAAARSLGQIMAPLLRASSPASDLAPSAFG